MPVIQGLEWTFDTVASKYERLRPGYVNEMYKELFDYININELSNVMEIGIGGGQATLPILLRGCKVTAVEYGETFCKICREKFKGYPKFSVINGKFEDIDFVPNSYDLIYSASAFHWIPEDIGYNKVFSLLKHGGVFARFANHPHSDKGRPELTKEIEDIYAKYYCKYYKCSSMIEKDYGKEEASARAKIAEKYGFNDICYDLFYRKRSFTGSEYVTLIGTYSDHIAIEAKIRDEFFHKIEEAINRHGGKITIYDTIDLELARKL